MRFKRNHPPTDRRELIRILEIRTQRRRKTLEKFRRLNAPSVLTGNAARLLWYTEHQYFRAVRKVVWDRVPA